MIYFDNAATTPVKKEVLDTYIKVTDNFIGNANSTHALGIKSMDLMKSATDQIANILKVDSDSIIYTSSGSESNNTAIMGVVNFYKNRGKRILTTDSEHSSVKEVMNYLGNNGYDIVYLKTLDTGLIDIDFLINELNKGVLMVSIASVNSETGLKQDIDEIKKIIKGYTQTILHVDATQSIGKVEFDCSMIDLITMSPHKFFGLKGIGILIKNTSIEIDKLIKGGKSTTEYRAGTPALNLIVSTSKALRLAYNSLKDDNLQVTKVSNFLVSELTKIKEISLNRNKFCIPHIINFSLKCINATTFMNELSNKNIFIGTQSACSRSLVSKSVLKITGDEKKSRNSVRVSLSCQSTMEEAQIFLTEVIKICQ